MRDIIKGGENMTGIQNTLNAKLAEVRKNKAAEQARFNALTKQREQAERNYIALDGAEQILLELIKETETHRSDAVLANPDTEIIEEVSADDASDNG